MINNDADQLDDELSDKPIKKLVLKQLGSIVTVETQFPRSRALEIVLHMIMKEMSKKGDKLDKIALTVNTYYFILIKERRERAAKKDGRYSAELDEPLPTNDQEYMDYWRNLMETRER